MESTAAATELPIFIIDHNPEVDWPVVVQRAADGGKLVAHQFIARFKVLSHADYDALFGVNPAAAADQPAAALSAAEELAADAEKFAKVITGWGGRDAANWMGPQDAQGQPIAFTPATLMALATGPYGQALSAGLWKALAEIRWGAAAKN